MSIRHAAPGADPHPGASPSSPSLTREEYVVEGVKVHAVRPERPHPTPLVFVHGGVHAAWTWELMMPFLAERGWEGHALDWYGHGGSTGLPADELARRSIADVTTEIGHVVDRLDRRPVLVGHSQGGMAVQKYAEHHPHAGLVLLAPVVPGRLGAAAVEIPVTEGQLFEPPPFAMAQQMFFEGMDEEVARRYHARLCAESTQAVIEATRWTLEVDPTRISGPLLVVGAEHDRLVPPEAVRRLASLLGGDYRFQLGRGHSLPYEPGWADTARLIDEWLRASVDR